MKFARDPHEMTPIAPGPSSPSPSPLRWSPRSRSGSGVSRAEASRAHISASIWDRRVDAWESVSDSPSFQELAARIATISCPTDADVVVDLGAGTGLLALSLAAAVTQVVAVDSSAAMLERLSQNAARQGAANVVCLQADMTHLPLPDESATIVVSSYAFHHLDRRGKELALAEARRILRPGGLLVVADMMFALSFRRRDREIVLSKVLAIARRGPAGIIRLGRNAARIATRRWEHPEDPQAWIAMLAGRHFMEASVELLTHETGLAVARRPLPGAARCGQPGGRCP